MRRINRRRLVRSLVAATAYVGLSGRVTRARSGSPVTIIAPGPQGGGFDRFARALGHAIEQAALAPAVAYENIGAAGGVSALPHLAELGATRPAVLMVTGSVMVGAFLTARSDNLLDKFMPIARLAVEPLAIAAGPGGPATAADLVTFLQREGAVVVAGGPNGSPDHLVARSIAAALQLPPRQLAYQPHAGGRPAAENVLAGNAHLVLTNVSDLVPFAADGRLRIIAVTEKAADAERIAPTLRQSGIESAGGNWRGVVASPRIDGEKATRLVALVEQVARSAAWRQELRQRRWIDAFLSGAAFSDFLRADYENVRAALTSAGGGRVP